MTPANPLDLIRTVRQASEALIRTVRQASEALISGDALANATAELLAVVSDEMEDAGAYEHHELDGDGDPYSMVSTEGGDARPDWATVLKIAHAALNQPRTWDLPSEPGPEVRRLQDSAGHIWHRSGRRWDCPARKVFGAPWWDLLSFYAPVVDATAEVSAPPAGAETVTP